MHLLFLRAFLTVLVSCPLILDEVNLKEVASDTRSKIPFVPILASMNIAGEWF
jgi:hypothetical protein